LRSGSNEQLALHEGSITDVVSESITIVVFRTNFVRDRAMNFAQLLRMHRDAAGLTQKGLAEAAGLTQAGIALYESGQREPTWAAVQKLADALGVSVEVFRETADTPAGIGSLSHPEPEPAKKPKGGAKKKGKK
jgi:DNA-binding XRE family transcriptional regulator